MTNRSRGSRRLWRSLLIAGAAACAGLDQAAQPVHVLVTNATCSSGQCTAIRVRAFPDNQPHTPGGLWSLDLGTVSSASACLTIPATAKFEVTGPEGTTTYRWTTDRPLSLGALLPSESALQAAPSTTSFVPSSADGWAVTLPTAASASPTKACTP